MPASVTRILSSVFLAIVISGSLAAQNLDERYPVDFYQVESSGRYPSLSRAFEIPPPELEAPIALLIELETGTVLYDRNADRPFPPASLTKIMTVYTALEIYEASGTDMDDEAAFSPAAWASNAPPQSSLMFLGPDQKVSISELILGLLVSSGNDAAMAIAETSAGTMEGFILRMNRNARTLGLESTAFVDSSGYSAANRTSAFDMARLTQLYLDRWPWVIDRFHKVQQFTYPKPENLLSGNSPVPVGITQRNRNGLLETYPGATGIKTGYIDESGYNILASAEREGMHLLAVIMGISAADSAEGSRLREADASSLLDWGFENFSIIDIPLPEYEIPVSRGRRDTLKLPEQSAALVISDGGGDLSVRSRAATALLAPVETDQVIERYEWSQDGIVLGVYEREAEEPVPSSSGLEYAWDSVVLFFRRLVSGFSPVEGDLEDFLPTTP
jgi:D-alanyl-D-alanine carboxypeptidase (penicillin-binding protein 5/6)